MKLQKFATPILVLALSSGAWAQIRTGPTQTGMPGAGTGSAGAAAGSQTSSLSQEAIAPTGIAPVRLGSFIAPLSPTPNIQADTLPESKQAAVPALAAEKPEFAILPQPAVPSDGTPSTAKPREQPYYLSALAKLGAPQGALDRLEGFMASRHPGRQDRIYHSLSHSREVAGLIAFLIATHAQRLPVRVQATLILAAALHDIDPMRAPDSPPRVQATLDYLDSDRGARAILLEFDRLFNVQAGQVKALIKSTDFAPDPEVMAKLEAAAKAMAAAEFTGIDRAWAETWRLKLRFADKISSYLGTPEQAMDRVSGLAHELREAAAIAKGEAVSDPTDDALIGTSHAFLDALKKDPEYRHFPTVLQDRFETVSRSFLQQRKDGAVPMAEGKASPARAPPTDIARAERYVRSIMGSKKPDERTMDALLDDFMESAGITPGSKRALDIRRSLVPGRYGAEQKAEGNLDPRLKEYASVVIAVARRHRMTPKALEGIIRSQNLFPALSLATGREQADGIMERAVFKARVQSAVAAYPATPQGDFMRDLASSVLTPSGKSIEEISRAGAFIYADFSGSRVLRAATGRDPDQSSSHMVFYAVFQEGRWKISGYRKNPRGPSGMSDSELLRALKSWLFSGGIPASAIVD